MSNAYNDSLQTGPFETFVAQWNDEVTATASSVESWVENKLDTNPAFNFGPAKTALHTALTNFMNAVLAVTAT